MQLHWNAGVLRAWLVLGVWTVLVWTLSSDTFGSATTSRILGPLVSWLWPDLDRQGFLMAHFLVRKAMHVVIYAVLGALALRAVRISVDLRWALHGAIALAMVVGVACADELRQKYSSLRVGSPADVGIDAVGGLLGISLGGALGSWRDRRRAGRPGASDRERR